MSVHLADTNFESVLCFFFSLFRFRCFRCHNMGIACKRVRHKVRRDRNQDQSQQHNATIYCEKQIVDRSSNLRLLTSVRRQRNDSSDQCARRRTINENRAAPNASNSNNSTVTASLLRDDRNDMDDSLEIMDDENMVQCNNKIAEKSILSHQCETLTPIMVDQLKCGRDLNEHRMSSSLKKNQPTIVCRCECEIMSKLSAIFAAPLWFAGGGTNTISRFFHMINFKRKFTNHHHHHSIFTLSPSHTELETIAPTKLKINNNNHKNQNKTANYSEAMSTRNSNNNNIGHSNSKCKSNKNSDDIKSIYNKGHNNRRTIITSSQCFIRQSVCLYAASGFLIALCFLATPAAASIDSLHPM